MADNKNDILLKLKIQTDKANAALKKTEVQIKKTIQSFKGLTKGSLEYQEAQAKLASQQATYAQQSEKYNNSLKIQTAAQASAAKQTNKLASASGGATTSVLELGRIVSDAPYGIRGMANNISQLASNMLFTSQQVDKTTGKIIGFGGVLKQMGKTFMGPLGLLFLIQGAIALLDGFAGGAKKANDATEDFSASISGNASKLLILNQVLLSSNTSMSDKKEIINDVNSEFKGLNISLDENGNLTDASRVALDKLTNSMVKNAKAQAIMNKITEEQSTIVDIEIEQSAKIRKAAAENTLGVGVFKGTLDGLIKKQNEYIERYQRQIDYNNLTEQKKKDAMESYMNTTTMQRFENLKNFRKDDLKDAEKNIADMVALLTGTDLDTFVYTPKEDGKDKKLSPFATPKELEIDVKNAENAIIQYEKQIKEARLKEELNDKLSEATTEEEKKKIREQYQLDRLKNQLNAEKKMLDLKLATEKKVVNTKRDNHIADLKRATDLYIHKVKLNNKLSDKEKEQMIGIAKSQLQIATNQANTEADDAITQIKDKYKTLFGFFEQLGIARKGALISSFSAKKETKKDKDSDLEFGIKQYMALQSGLTDFLNGEYDRQLTIEQNKTNAMNNQLRERLNNENLSAEERKNIQLQIARNDEQLRKKQEGIERKRFKMNKALNISQALMATYLSAQKAYLSQLQLTPDSPIRAKIAAGVATAIGLANVAMISRQKFQSSVGASPTAGALGGGSGGGDNTREFNFNLAGSTQSNQLTQSIAGQLSQPIQTYVVSSEITSQQQLDLNIANTATIGG
jgi:hypothetical protein